MARIADAIKEDLKQITFNKWAEDYGLDHEPLTLEDRRADCEAAWNAALKTNQYEQLQKTITEALKDFVGWVAFMIGIVVVISWLISISPIGRDSTDEQGWFGKRSNVEIIRDKLTGCQYLQSSTGLTPRILYNEHFGCEKPEDVQTKQSYKSYKYY